MEDSLQIILTPLVNTKIRILEHEGPNLRKTNSYSVTMG
jgi:hypothetical protein